MSRNHTKGNLVVLRSLLLLNILIIFNCISMKTAVAILITTFLCKTLKYNCNFAKLFI